MLLVLYLGLLALIVRKVGCFYMNIRKTISLVLLISFVPLVLSSIILYLLAPHGGPSSSAASWTLLGLGKRQWVDIHLNLGLLFLASGLAHLCYNWRSIVAYMKNKKKNFSLATPVLALALAINLLFIGGTLLKIPPFSFLLELNRKSTRPALSQQVGPAREQMNSTAAAVSEQIDTDVLGGREDRQAYGSNGYGRNGHGRDGHGRGLGPRYRGGYEQSEAIVD